MHGAERSKTKTAGLVAGPKIVKDLKHFDELLFVMFEYH